MKLFGNALSASLFAATEVYGFVQERTSSMSVRPDTDVYRHLLARNNRRVEILDTACQLNKTAVSELSFTDLKRVQHATINGLRLDEELVTMGTSIEDEQHLEKETLAKFQLVDLFRIEQNKIMACLPPKAGTTNWQRYFASLIDPSREPEEFEVPDVFGVIPRVLDEKQTLDESLMQDETEYIRMINTRHPFARLLSGWRQKFDKTFHNIQIYLNRYGRKISKFQDEAPSTHHFSFKQFLYYVANGKMEDYDYHWQSITYQCLPCQMQYDIIVQQESSASDAAFFTQHNQLEGLTYLPGQYADSPLLSASLVEQFKGLPRSLIERLYKIYYFDFILFNYSIDEFIDVAENHL